MDIGNSRPVGVGEDNRENSAHFVCLQCKGVLVCLGTGFCLEKKMIGENNDGRSGKECLQSLWRRLRSLTS